MHYKKTKNILLPGNRINLYRGCLHGCIYCDSRSKCYHMRHNFEDIEIKENALELLEQKLFTKREKCMISTGSMTDPYLPIENKLQYVRKTLELIYKYGYGFSVITKSNLILRDIDLLKKINDKTKCVVQMTLTISDDELSRKIEPNVATTTERFKVLKEMQKAGIPTIVWLSPVLPYITDTEKNIRSILKMCVEAKVYGIICFDMGMTLREGNREYYYQKLDELFPGLKEKYIKKYQNNYFLLSPNNDKLMKIFAEECDKYGIKHDVDELFKYLETFEKKDRFIQQSIFDIDDSKK